MRVYPKAAVLERPSRGSANAISFLSLVAHQVIQLRHLIINRGKPTKVRQRSVIGRKKSDVAGRP